LSTLDVFLDMLTDSGTNAMSDNQVSPCYGQDDALRRLAKFRRMETAVREVFGTQYVFPFTRAGSRECHFAGVHQTGRRDPMNYHFTTTKAHMEISVARSSKSTRMRL